MSTNLLIQMNESVDDSQLGTSNVSLDSFIFWVGKIARQNEPLPRITKIAEFSLVFL